MTTPLFRNRDYQLLWASQALSQFGLRASAIAFPLVILALTNSAGAAGIVLAVSTGATLVAGLPAGALVDRWDRKKVMLSCEAAQAVATASLVFALWRGSTSIAHIVVVATVMGVCGAMSHPAEEACLPNLVPEEQLSTAVAANAARSYLGQLTGTSAGGFLFAIARFVPFAVNTFTHLMAFVLLLFVRLPKRDSQPAAPKHIGREMVAGVKWMWGHRPVRVTGFFVVFLNLFFSAFFIVIIVVAQRNGVPSGEIGVMAAMFGVGGLLGAVATPALLKVLSPYLSILSVFWALTVLTPVAVIAHNGYAFGALFGCMAFFAPIANTTIDTYQLLITPDGMRGRMNAAMDLLTGIAGVAGPTLGGILLEMFSSEHAVLVCAAGLGVATLLATFNPTLRGFPRRLALDPETEPEPEADRVPEAAAASEPQHQQHQQP